MNGFRAFVTHQAERHGFVAMTPVRVAAGEDQILRFRHVAYSQKNWFEVRCLESKHPEGLLIGISIGSTDNVERRRIMTWTNASEFMDDFGRVLQGCVPAHVANQWGTHTYCHQCPRQLLCLATGSRA